MSRASLAGLRHQLALGETIARLERSKPKKRKKCLPLIRWGNIVIEGNIPARIIDYDSSMVQLEIGVKVYFTYRHYLEGRFRYQN